MRLKGKIAIVTGGSDGIGRHICLKLAAEGCKLAILGRNQERLDAVVAESLALGAAEARAYGMDLTDSDALDSTAQAILRDFDGVDILINNAGVWHKTGPLDTIAADILH